MNKALFLPALLALGSAPLALASEQTLASAPLAAVAAPAAQPSASIAANVVRAKVAGIDVLACRTGVRDVITLRASLPAGDSYSPASNPAVATLTAMMLDKGSQRRSQFEIAAELEAVGAEVWFGSGDVMASISGKCLTKDLPLLVSVIAEQLRTPAFAAEELEKARKRFIGSMRRQLERPESVASIAFSRAVFPVGHPNHEPTIEELVAAAERTTIEDVRAFHAAHYGPAQMVLVGVGDLDPAKLQAEVGKAFAGWTGGVPLASFAPVSAPALPETRVPMVDKPSVSVLLGQATGLRHRDPDAIALRVGTAILGSGFTGRLMSTVRDKEGLTYGIGSSVAGDTFCDGQWSITATFSPAMLAQGLASTRRELLLWHSKGVTSDELERRKSNMIGSFKVGLATSSTLADQLLTAVNRGYEPSWLDAYPAMVEALTVDQVNAVIRRHLDPDKMALVLAGDVKESPKQVPTVPAPVAETK